MIKKFGDVLGNILVVFLVGNGDLEKNFMFSELGKVDGVEIVDVVFKDKDSIFQCVCIGFVDKLLKMMEVWDNFGQVMMLLFIGFECNLVFVVGIFVFILFKGVDVVGD